jgi:hypothetical protein
MGMFLVFKVTNSFFLVFVLDKLKIILYLHPH